MKKGAVTQPGQQNLDAQARLDFEILISVLSSEFINLDPEQIDIKINDALKRIASFMEVERAFFFQFNKLKTEFVITHVWEAPDTPKDKIGSGTIVKDSFPWLSETLKAKKNAIINDVFELDHAETRLEYDYCRKIGIQSFMILPIKVVGEPLCAIGLDALRKKRQWLPIVIERLNLIGENFANAIAKKTMNRYIKILVRRYGSSRNSWKPKTSAFVRTSSWNMILKTLSVTVIPSSIFCPGLIR